MSAVLDRTRTLYRKVMLLESGLLWLLSLGIFCYAVEGGISFLLGGLASFLPFCLFAYWLFFRQSVAKKANKITAFYRGEGLKWLATIVLVVLGLKLYADLHIGLFFSGYFLFLVANSLLPIILKR